MSAGLKRKRIALILLLLPLLLLGGWALWQHLRDPLAAINYETEQVRLVEEHAYRSGRRIYQSIVLHHEELDTIRFTLSLPDDLGPEERVPVVPVLGGLEIGEKSLAYVSHPGRNALIAYEYPYGPEYWYEELPLTEIPGVRQAVLKVPAQMAAMTRWVLEQPWADTTRFAVFSYSFGAMFLPAFYRVAAEQGVPTGPGVMIYGGADLEELFRRNLRVEPLWVRDLTAWGIATAIRPVEPALHLPHIRGEFLVVNGTEDDLIPAECARLLQELTPEPKKVVNLETGHMNPKARDLIARLVEISRAWLLERDAIAP